MTINCKGNLVDLSSPKVMGILNITPDSFYDGGKYKNESEILNQVEKMLLDGATFIDVGAYSSRPGAQHISEEEELKRSLPVINLLLQHFPEIIISVDTFRSKVAKETINAGAALINDISGGKMDDNMFATVSKLQVPYILMHMLGTPQNMQIAPEYNNVVAEVRSYLTERLRVVVMAGMAKDRIVIDPGFGFGKNTEHNLSLLKHLKELKGLGVAVLVGFSRKSVLGKITQQAVGDRLYSSVAAALIAVMNGANIVRVHDVSATRDALEVFNSVHRS